LVQRPAQKDRHEGGLSAALIEAANQATTNAPARRSIYPASRSFTPNKSLVWSQNTGPAGETSKALLKRHNNSRQGCMKMRTKNENPCGFGFWCLRPEAVADRYLIFCRRLTVKSQNKNPPFQ
jgi:hypothetical protein